MPPFLIDPPALLDQLVAAVWIYDLEHGRILWANRAALILWGAADLDALRARDFTPVSEASRLRLRFTLDRVHGGERSVEEMWTFYPHGVATTVRCCLSGLRLPDGQRLILLEATVVHAADSQQDALRSIEAVRHTPAQIALFSTDGAVLMQNPAAGRVFGPGGAAGFVARFADPAEGEAAFARLQAGQAVSGEFRSATVEGVRWHTLDARLATDPATGRKLIVTSRADITDRVTAQQALAERSEEMRLLLDRQAQASRERGLLLENISEGLVMVDSAGRMSAERSAVMTAWFGPPTGDKQLLWECLGLDEVEAASLRLSWEALAADVLPLDLLLDQLPRRLRIRGRTLRVEYKPLLADGVLQRVMLVLRDVTNELARERLEAEQRELLEATDRMLHNRDGFRDFFADADRQVARLLDEAELPLVEVRRVVHTIKGNSGLYGLSTIATLCHEIETTMALTGAGLSASDRQELGRRWEGLRERLRPLIGHARSTRIELSMEEHDALLAAVAHGTPRLELLTMLRALRWQSAEGKLEHLAGQARALCERLGKGPPDVRVEAQALRVPPDRFAGFFSALVHVVRNAVDHGMEPPAERAAEGKPPSPRLTLRTILRGDEFVVELEDDGRGIDWARLADKARAAGLPAETAADLQAALFADGVSTKEEVTDVSGRGVGLAAVRVACAELGGRIEVHSALGVGTCFCFCFPASLVRAEAGVQPLVNSGHSLPRRAAPANLP